MVQNERVEPLPFSEFARYCKSLALQILKRGEKYDVVVVLLRGAHSVWSLLSYVIKAPEVVYVDVTRYPDGEMSSRLAPEFRSFPPASTFSRKKVLVLDDCADDGDTMFETERQIVNFDAALVHTGVVLCKPANLKIRDWRPTFVGWTDAPGNVYYDFPAEAWEKEVRAALEARSMVVPIPTA